MICRFVVVVVVFNDGGVEDEAELLREEEGGREIMVEVNPDFSVLGVMEREEVSVMGLVSMGIIPFSISDF